LRSKSTKSLARERALQFLYQHDVTGAFGDVAISRFQENFHPDERPPGYFQQLVYGVKTHLAELDAYIARFSEHWRLERMALIDRNVLRLAIFELLHSPQVPPKVAINEAIELAKRYGGEDSGAFVNGILDRVWEARFGKDAGPG